MIQSGFCSETGVRSLIEANVYQEQILTVLLRFLRGRRREEIRNTECRHIEIGQRFNL